MTSGLEMAIAHAVASELKECDKMDRPLYTIKTTTRHEISLEETCVPQVSDNSCHVITGVTEILLDYFSANARDKSYDSIEDLFSNKEMMQLFAPTVAYATFLGPINEILVIQGDDSNNVPGVTVAVLVFTSAPLSDVKITIVFSISFRLGFLGSFVFSRKSSRRPKVTSFS